MNISKSPTMRQCVVVLEHVFCDLFLDSVSMSLRYVHVIIDVFDVGLI